MYFPFVESKHSRGKTRSKNWFKNKRLREKVAKKNRRMNQDRQNKKRNWKR